MGYESMIDNTQDGMTKQKILDRLEQIVDSMDTDFLNRYAIEGIVEDIKDLQWKINIGLKIDVN